LFGNFDEQISEKIIFKAIETNKNLNVILTIFQFKDYECYKFKDLIYYLSVLN